MLTNKTGVYVMQKQSGKIIKVCVNLEINFWCKAKKNNTLVSGNAGDEKNLHSGDCKKFFCQVNWSF